MIKFPFIETIDDVLPFVKHQGAFTVTEHQWGTSIDYQYPQAGTFSTPQARECRGIKFGLDGRILARPYHKFFRIGEARMRTEELIAAGRFEDKYTILYMPHGSMIHPIVHNDTVFFCTRSGITDVAEQALRFVTPVHDSQNAGPWCKDFCYDLAKSNLTPIFEWCPQVEPVQKYPANRLVLTAIRTNHTGEYITYDQMQALAGSYYIPMIGSFNGDWTDVAKDESYVIRWNDGMMGKLRKNNRDK